MFGNGDNYYPMPLETYQSQVLAYLHKRQIDILRETIRDYKNWLKSQGKPMNDFYRYLVGEYKSLTAEGKEEGKE